MPNRQASVVGSGRTAVRMAHIPNSNGAGRPAGRGWRWLLVLPYLGLGFPALYARTTPALWGFPFFYWYQFAWVIVASGLIGVVYRMHRD